MYRTNVISRCVTRAAGTPLLFCAVVHGNSFPVVEEAEAPVSFKAKPISPRADSHITVVSRSPLTGGYRQVLHAV